MINLRAVNIAGMWTAVSVTAGVMTYLWGNLAWTSDIQRIEVNQLKSEVRALCYKVETAPPEARKMVDQFLMEAVDDLCAVDSSSRYCKGATADEICL